MNGRAAAAAVKGRPIAILLIVAAALPAIFQACGSARRGEPLVEPIDLTDPLLVGGRYSFMQRCHSCHPGGDSGLGPALNNKRLLPNFLIRFQVRNGLGRMPAFPKALLADEELDGIVAYLSFLQGLERK